MKKLFIVAFAALGMLACSDFNAPSTSPATVDGELTGIFSIAPNKRVHFSKGNLQFQASTKTWRFAENQYEMIGEDNDKISSSYNGWIDLFGWGTSGYNEKYPYMTSVNASDYCSLTEISSTDYDWGWHNKISNGGNQIYIWRTLTEAEWGYIISSRPNANNLRGGARVNGVYGYVLLPDNWHTPSDLHWDGYQNRYSSAEWNKMEKAGAVFLPCAGYRKGKEVKGIAEVGDYWMSSRTNLDGVYRAGIFECTSSGSGYFMYSQVGSDDCRYEGKSVRLVQDVK